MRKPRSDSVLKNLPLAQREALTTWLVDEGMAQLDAIKKIEEEFGLTVGKNAVSDFYRDECLPIRYQRSTRSAQTLRELLEAAPGTFDAATIKAVEQRVFDLATDPESSAGEIATLAGVLGESRKLTLKEKELTLKQTQGDATVALAEKRLAQQQSALELATERVRTLERNAAASRERLKAQVAELRKAVDALRKAAKVNPAAAGDNSPQIKFIKAKLDEMFAGEGEDADV